MMELPSQPKPNPPVPRFEDQPLTRSEYIAAITHFYRAEMHRATAWRVRLDTTTNWSIISVMALISYSMGDPERSQIGIVVGMVLVFTFLVIEARRFRFFDVWRSRVRMLEQNFIGPILTKTQISPVADWGKKVAEDLSRPRYKLTWHQALRLRLVRNYVPMFLLLLACWAIKIKSLYHPFEQENWFAFIWQRVDEVGIPVWTSMSIVAVLYSYLLTVVCLARTKHVSDGEFWKEDLQEVRDFDQ